jgi:hypothetical protein
MSARGEGKDPNDMCPPLDILPSLYHVLNIDPKELNSVNATNIVDNKCAECLAVARSFRPLSGAGAIVIDLAFESMCRPDDIKPYQIAKNAKFEITYLNMTQKSRELRVGSLEALYPVSTSSSTLVVIISLLSQHLQPLRLLPVQVVIISLLNKCLRR